MKALEDRMEAIKEFIGELREKRREEGAGGLKSDSSLEEVSEGRSRFNSRASSKINLDRSCDSFSDREIDKIKQIIVEKEKEEKKNNIVLKEVGPEATKEWVKDFIKDKLGVEVKVVK